MKPNFLRILAMAAIMADMTSEKEDNSPLKEDNTPKKIGDRVKVIDEHHLNYFIDVTTDEQLSTDYDSLSEAVKDIFSESEMIVVETGIDKKYNCGHCDNEHTHDTIVFLPGINKRYYCTEKYLVVK